MIKILVVSLILVSVVSENPEKSSSIRLFNRLRRNISSAVETKKTTMPKFLIEDNSKNLKKKREVPSGLPYDININSCQRRKLLIKPSDFSEFSNVARQKDLNIYFCAGDCQGKASFREQILYELSNRIKLKNDEDLYKIEKSCCVPSSYSKLSLWLDDGSYIEINDLVVQACHCVS